MKQSVLKFFMLALLGVVGASTAWAEDFSPTADYSVRMNNTNDGYSWFKNSDGEFELKQGARIFGLQTYTVTDLAAAKKITLVLKGGKSTGTDASAIWVFTENDWTTSTSASDMETAFSNTTGVTHGATGTTTSTYLMINTTINRSTTGDVQTCNFEISGEKLAKLKSVASGNTFTLLITNAVSDVEGNTSTQRKYYSSANATDGNRPYVAVEYDPVVLETNSTISTYTTLNAAFNAIASAGTGTITLYDDATITGRCDSGTKNINVVPAKEGIKITSTLTNSLWFLTQSGGTISIGSDSYQLVVDGSNNTNSSCFVEAGNGGNSSTTFKNVKFLNCVTSASAVTGSIICYKSNNGDLYLNNVSFEGCQATSENCSMIFCGLGELNIQGSLNITDCTSDYDIFIENSNKYDKIIKYKTDATEPTNPIRLYFKTPTLGTIALSTDYTDMTSWFKVLNPGCGLGYNGSNGDNDLTEASDLTVTDAGAATLVLPFEAKIPEGVTAYTLTHTDGSSVVTATEVTGGTLAANTPVLLNAEAGTYKFVNTSLVDATTTGSGPVTYGALTGVYSDLTFTTENIASTYANTYILNKINDNVGFYKAADGLKVGANRCYLTATNVPGAAAARGLEIAFDDEVTGLNEVSGQKEEVRSDYFNLAGQRVAQPTKGLYIVNGKKVVIK